MALELIDALKQLFQCSFIVMHSIIKFSVGEKKSLFWFLRQCSKWVCYTNSIFLWSLVIPGIWKGNRISCPTLSERSFTAWNAAFQKLIKSWTGEARLQRNQSFCNHVPLFLDKSVDLIQRNLFNQPADLLIIHCYFCCGSLAFFKLHQVSPAEWNMVSITTLQQFDNHHGCHSPHLKSAHSWLRASPWGSSAEPYLLWNGCMLLL